jgi:adenine phosphoribosyltransferase
MLKVLDLQGVQMFVVAEAMGIHIGTTLSLMTDIPFTIVRKRKYELPGELALHQTTGYSKGELYMNGVHRGDRVAIVDDVLSTGGTMKALIRGLDQVGAEIADICVAIRRGKQDVGRPVKALVDIEVVGGKVHIVGRSL